MGIKSVWLCVLLLSLQFVGGQISDSPCPGTFDFEIDGDDVYGVVTVKPDDDQEPVSVLDVRVNATQAWSREEFRNYKAKLKKWKSEHTESEWLADKKRSNLQPISTENLRKYNEGQTIKYRTHIYSTEIVVVPLPKVAAISVNGEIICLGPGDEPGPIKKLVLEMSLHHKSVLNSDTSGATYETQEQAKPLISLSFYLPEQEGTLSFSGPGNSNPNSSASSEKVECGLVSGGNERVPLIHNGNFYERGEIPWLVAIYRNVEKNLLFICGGTLVSDRHVVTAAHCMWRRSAVTPMIDIVVRIGVHSLNGWSDDLTVIRQLIAATIHEEYNLNTLQNDILVLTLDKRVKFNRYIRPACLWSGDTALSRVVGATGVVAGWGDRSVENIGGKLDEPRMVRVPIVSTKDCRSSKSDFHRLTYNTTLCAGDQNGAGPCTGDSGGGIYLLDGGKWRLRGVVSVSLQRENGAQTCNLNEYVVYTDTAQFLPWIRNVLSEKYYD